MRPGQVIPISGTWLLQVRGGMSCELKQLFPPRGSRDLESQKPSVGENFGLRFPNTGLQPDKVRVPGESCEHVHAGAPFHPQQISRCGAGCSADLASALGPCLLLTLRGGGRGRKGRVGLRVLPETRCPGIPEPPKIFTASSLECPQTPSHPPSRAGIQPLLHQQLLHRILHQLLPILVLFTQERPQLLALPASPPTQSRGLLFVFFLSSLHKEHWI